MIIDFLLLLCLLVFAIGSVYSTRLIFAAIFLALTSVVTTLLMFKLSSPIAAVFELSVCAGLITVIFISVISLVKPYLQEQVDILARIRQKKYIYLPVILLIVGIFLMYVPFVMDIKLPFLAGKTDVRNTLWNLRHADLLGQLIMLLAGAFGILVLFNERNKK